jgi:tRNA-intron endonuclease
MTRIQSLRLRDFVVTENSNEARELYTVSRFGVLLPDGRVQLSFFEALYLLEKGKIQVLDGHKKPISAEKLMRFCSRLDKRFWVRYAVFKNIRNRGYIIKTALKFGADFRVYARGKMPGEAHAKWVVFPVHEAEALTWQDFAAKNRVAHSTKKRLMMGIVDDEGDVTYYEIRWLRP